MVADEEAGLNTARTNAFGQITDNANARGVLFSGIPIEGQAKYVGETYLPSLANLRGRYANQKFTLQGALAELEGNKFKQAQGVRESELNREQAAAEAAASRAAARAASGGGGAFSPGFTPAGGGGGNEAAPTAQGVAWQDDLKGFLARAYAQNPKADRKTQDNWVRAWATSNKLDPNTPDFWSQYNTLYPWEQYNDSRFNQPAAAPKAPTNPVTKGGASLSNSLTGALSRTFSPITRLGF